MPETRSTKSLGIAIGILWVIGMMQNAGNAADPDAQPHATGSCESFPPLLFAAEGAKKILRYGRDGAVVWEYPAEMSRDVWQLTGGNVLFCYNRNYDSGKHDNPSGVMEVTPDKRVVFHFETTGQVWSCQRLADGNTLVGASSQGKLLIVSQQGEIIWQIKVVNRPGHSCMRNARQLANGNFLVAEESAQAVREYDPSGKLVREIKVKFAPYSAVRLDDGQTVICGQLSVVEIGNKDEVVWYLEGKELPQIGVRWFAGIQILPSGNLFLCNAGGKVAFVEVTRAKRIVWQSSLAASVFPLGHGVHRLDIPGTARK